MATTEEQRAAWRRAGEVVVKRIKAEVERATTPLIKRLDEIETRLAALEGKPKE